MDEERRYIIHCNSCEGTFITMEAYEKHSCKDYPEETIVGG